MALREFNATVRVQLDGHQVLLAVGDLYANGLGQMSLMLHPGPSREMLGALLLLVASDLLPDELQVKAMSMVAAIVERANNEGSLPF